jgi:hypothetical protein
VWAVGNAADARAHVITAAGEGSTAAISINADLVQEDIETTLYAAPHLRARDDRRADRDLRADAAPASPAGSSPHEQSNELGKARVEEAYL